MFEGTVTVGGVVSITVIVNPRLALLLWASVPEHFTVVVPNPKTLPDARSQLTATEPSTLSVAETAKLTVAPATLVASVVMLAGTIIDGAVVSWTVTLKLLLDEL